MTETDGSHTLQVCVLVPTYNERESLPGVLSRTRAAVPEADILVLDDASPDGTGEVADAWAAGDERVRVLHRPGKSGLGQAYLAGFAWAAERGYDAVVQMDADGSHLPEQLPRLLAAADGADVVIGSRWVPGGAIHHWPAHRRLLSRGGNVYTRVALGLPVRDATAGFRVYRVPALLRLGLADVASQGYCFQVDLTLRAIEQRLRVVEVPIDFVEREQGRSKMGGEIVREALLRVSLWGLRRRGSQLAQRLPGRPSRAGRRQPELLSSGQEPAP
ncbi:polyprenol monophosphomannose synthase [Ornithinicoccus halotolerans]|uniref:polyprenol monophosphomannose synthase n=1 Tax=Ornithinicoccus halotolerans TaxID=1748220 RepID=UPI00129667FD|nr:polyprenol monophosphomannose synthase [Ornithinicoccus halotolerans]